VAIPGNGSGGVSITEYNSPPTGDAMVYCGSFDGQGFTKVVLLLRFHFASQCTAAPSSAHVAPQQKIDRKASRMLLTARSNPATAARPQMRAATRVKTSTVAPTIMCVPLVPHCTAPPRLVSPGRAWQADLPCLQHNRRFREVAQRRLRATRRGTVLHERRRCHDARAEPCYAFA